MYLRSMNLCHTREWFDPGGVVVVVVVVGGKHYSRFDGKGKLI